LPGVLVLALALAAWPDAARAHQGDMTYAKVKIAPDRAVEVRALITAADLEKAIDTSIRDGKGRVVRGRIKEAAPRVLAYVRANVSIAGADGKSCAPKGEPRLFPEMLSVLVRLEWDCAKTPGELFYTSRLLLDHSATARHLVRFHRQGKPQRMMLDSETTRVSLTGPPPTWREVAGRYIIAGTEHIFIGYDHIAFILALLLWARRTWAVVKIVTAFTIAHTVTLTLAVLDVVSIPIWIAEAAIALSIVYVAAENFLRREVAGRWKPAFVLGLAHGFGFAGVLREFGLPGESVGLALASFNIGVEIGQVAIVCVFVPALLGVDRLMSRLSGAGAKGAGETEEPAAQRKPALVYTASGVILALGLYWFAERVLFA